MMKKIIVNRKTLYVLCIITLCAVAGTIFVTLYLNRIASQVESRVKDKKYNWHVAFIPENYNDSFMCAVIESAKKIGKQNGIIVEAMGKELKETYTKKQLIELSIDAKVDGIILEGDEEASTKGLIEKAKQAGIPVVTVQSDCAGSERESFIGINHYKLGQDYGEQILRLTHDKTAADIAIIMDKHKGNEEQVIIYGSLCQTLAYNKKTKYNVEAIQIDRNVAFEAEEKIRDVFIKDKLPDFIICLNELYTTCAVQAIIDRNKVGKTKILGFYENETIRDAIQDQVVQSTITVDEEEMGYDCIRSLLEYFETGCVSEYMTVNTYEINQEYLQDE